MNTEELTRIVVEALEDVKAKDIKVFNTEKLTDQFERVVIASGSSNRQTRALAFSVSSSVKQAGGDVTLDIVDDLGHAIDDRSMQFAIERLRYTVPKHYFDEALSGSTPKGDDIIEML